MMKEISIDELRQLAQPAQGCYIAIYMPTHRQHPQNQQDPIRFKNLSKLALVQPGRYAVGQPPPSNITHRRFR